HGDLVGFRQAPKVAPGTDMLQRVIGAPVKTVTLARLLDRHPILRRPRRLSRAPENHHGPCRYAVSPLCSHAGPRLAPSALHQSPAGTGRAHHDLLHVGLPDLPQRHPDPAPEVEFPAQLHRSDARAVHLFRCLLPDGHAGRPAGGGVGLQEGHRGRPGNCRCRCAGFLARRGPAPVPRLPGRAVRAGHRHHRAAGGRQPLRGPARAGEDQLQPADQLAYQAQQAQAVQGPYIGLAVVLFLLAAFVWLFRLPALAEATDKDDHDRHSFAEVLRHPHVLFGVLGIFFYVGAEVSIGSFMVNYLSMPDIGHLSEQQAAKYVSYYWLGAMVGRFVGSALMARISPRKLLATFAGINALLVLTTMLS